MNMYTFKINWINIKYKYLDSEIEINICMQNNADRNVNNIAEIKYAVPQVILEFVKIIISIVTIYFNYKSFMTFWNSISFWLAQFVAQLMIITVLFNV